MPVHPKIRISAILVGLLLVGGICAISPYNNYFLENSRLAGNHLPVGSILGLLLLVFIVNLPLRFLRWKRSPSKYIEQELVGLGDVKIVENDVKEAWAYFIQIVFNIAYQEHENEQHLPVVDISICFYEGAEGLLGFYTPVGKPSLDQLDEFCKDIVIDFNRQYLEPERKNETH